MRLKILVVDDEPQFERLMRQRFRKRLRNEEFEFIFAENGQHALQQLEKHPDIDLILSDINMPVMDGLEATRRIRSDVSIDDQPYIVAMTASAMEEDRRACLASGMNLHLCKPITLLVLLKALKQASANRTSARAHPKGTHPGTHSQTSSSASRLEI